MERPIYDFINRMLPDNSDPQQHGFRKAASTTTNMLAYSSRLALLRESGLKAITVHLDLKSAFDRVSHDLLFEVLADMGLPWFLLNWLYNYLTMRRHVVKLNGEISSPFSNKWRPARQHSRTTFVLSFYCKDHLQSASWFCF